MIERTLKSATITTISTITPVITPSERWHP